MPALSDLPQSCSNWIDFNQYIFGKVMTSDMIEFMYRWRPNSYKPWSVNHQTVDQAGGLMVWLWYKRITLQNSYAWALYDHGEPGTRITTCLPTLTKFPHDGFMEMIKDAWQIKPGKPTISTSSQDHHRWHHELHHPRLQVYDQGSMFK